MTRRHGRIRVLRVIARLNMGGPAHHVALLGSMLDPERYETLLLHGEVGLGEASLEEAARTRRARMQSVPGLRPEIRPVDDARALVHLARAVRWFRPDIVHTHTAKAGMLGRLAAVVAGNPRPIVVHTYHGHVLEGYFGPARNALYRGIERRLARISDRLIGVSAATVDDLVRLRIAEQSRFEVVPIGLDLTGFTEAAADSGDAFRREAGAGREDVLVTFVGRLAPIKRADVLLRTLARARQLGAPVRLAVVGDGDVRPALEREAARMGIADRVHFAGYRADMVSVASATDIALLTSDNEGTPVWLIEASAAAVPGVATRVGGVPDVITPDTGILAPAGDVDGLARGLAMLAQSPDVRGRLGAQARRHAMGRFSAERLVRDIDVLYGELIERQQPETLGPEATTSSLPTALPA